MTISDLNTNHSFAVSLETHAEGHQVTWQQRPG